MTVSIQKVACLAASISLSGPAIRILDSTAPIPGALPASDSGNGDPALPGSGSVPESSTAIFTAGIGFAAWRRRGGMNRRCLRILCLTAVAIAARADDDGRGFVASLQNCTELIGFGPASFAVARAQVPSAYAVVSFNGSAGLVVRASRCESVRSAGNSESRPVLVAQVGIAVVPLDGTGDINNYQLMYATTDPRLADAMNDAGVPAVLDRSLAYEFTPGAGGHGEVYAAVSPTSAQPAWFLTGTADLPPPSGAAVVANWWFNHSRRVVKMSTSIPSINYGAASFSLHTSKSSLLGQLIGGNTDAAFVLFNARGAFATGALIVTIH